MDMGRKKVERRTITDKKQELPNPETLKNARRRDWI